jgi:hypothetical protein
MGAETTSKIFDEDDLSPKQGNADGYAPGSSLRRRRNMLCGITIERKELRP